MYQIIIHKIVVRLSSKTNKKLFAHRVIDELNAKPQYIVQNVIWVRIPPGKEKTDYETK